jgi:hypothetical protein
VSTTVRSQDEIVKWLRPKADLFGFCLEAASPFLDFDHLRPCLRDDLSEEEIAHAKAFETKPLTREALIETMRDYMDFAWEKAIDERGISASRSVEKFATWLYMLGDDQLVLFAEDDDNFPMYGKPVLRRICESYGFAIPDGAA